MFPLQPRFPTCPSSYIIYTYINHIICPIHISVHISVHIPYMSHDISHDISQYISHDISPRFANNHRGSHWSAVPALEAAPATATPAAIPRGRRWWQRCSWWDSRPPAVLCSNPIGRVISQGKMMDLCRWNLSSGFCRDSRWILSTKHAEHGCFHYENLWIWVPNRGENDKDINKL